MSGKSQTIGDFTFCRPSQILPIYQIIARGLSQILPIMNLAGNGKCAKNRNLNTSVTAFQQHGCTQAYAAYSPYICVLALVNARFSILRKQKPAKRRTKRFWIREYLKKRVKYGQFHTLFSELHLSDREYFLRYIGMSPERFEHLLTPVAPYIQKKACRSRDLISPAE